MSAGVGTCRTAIRMPMPATAQQVTSTKSTRVPTRIHLSRVAMARAQQQSEGWIAGHRIIFLRGGEGKKYQAESLSKHKASRRVWPARSTGLKDNLKTAGMYTLQGKSHIRWKSQK